MDAIRAEQKYLLDCITFLNSEKDHLMARTDDLSAIVTTMTATIEGALAEVADLKSKLAAATAEDPAVGAAVDNLTALEARLASVVPAPAPAPVEELVPALAPAE